MPVSSRPQSIETAPHLTKGVSKLDVLVKGDMLLASEDKFRAGVRALGARREVRARRGLGGGADLHRGKGCFLALLVLASSVDPTLPVIKPGACQRLGVGVGSGGGGWAHQIGSTATVPNRVTHRQKPNASGWYKGGTWGKHESRGMNGRRVGLASTQHAEKRVLSTSAQSPESKKRVLVAWALFQDAAIARRTTLKKGLTAHGA